MSQQLLRIHLHSRGRTVRPASPRAAIDLTVKEAGQIIVVFALMLTFLIGLVGIAIDVTYAWHTGLQIQRAADAGAMAGVVYLPGNTGTGEGRALLEVGRNGYVDNSTTTVVAAPNPDNDRQLDVTITAQAPTFFTRIFGLDHWTITRKARAAYVMPVPMGSPLAYFGVGCLVLSTDKTHPACNDPKTTNGASGVTTSGTSGGTSLNSTGAWGAVITKDGDQGNGDAYSPQNDGSKTNVLYSPPGCGWRCGYQGYYYTVVLPQGGDIKIFDPGFCEMGSNGSGGTYGTGDHWIGNTYTGVSTYYSILNTNNDLLDPSNWSTPIYTSGTTFENEKGTDGGPNGKGSCDKYHNAWYTLNGATLPAGTYEVQVQTTKPGDPSINNTVNAENMFGILASGGGTPNVYGYDKMAVYNNLAGGSQKFYMAQVDQTTGAGKTLTIDLFDVGDSTAGYIRIWSPDQSASAQKLVGSFDFATFNYDASLNRVTPGNCVVKSYSACSGKGVSQITVAGTNGSSYNNTWIEITIPLPTNYGSNGLWQGGWWQVEYVVTAGNDTTTWSVNVNGNPVHLVPTD